MELFMVLFLGLMNKGITVGLISLVLILLRPVFKRVFTADQRTRIWAVAWFIGYLPMYGGWQILPVSFQSLLSMRTSEQIFMGAAFLPPSYDGAGTYHLALPGERFIPVELTDVGMTAALLIWLLGLVALCIFFWQRGKRLTALARRGRRLEKNDSLLIPYPELKRKTSADVAVWISRDLPTSFVRQTPFWEYGDDYEICLQAELPPEQMKLVLLHEMTHYHGNHLRWKYVATVNLVLFWWNPLVWLGFRYFCQDQELACDAAVLEKLEPSERKRYAETLVELGRGQPLLEVPLAFGECDAEIRVRAVVAWRRREKVIEVVTWCAAVVVMLFFFGGHTVPAPVEDMMLAYQRTGGGVEAFVRDLNDEMASELGYGKPYPELGIVQVWEGPVTARKVPVVWVTITDGTLLGEKTEVKASDMRDYASLWVNTTDGNWYQVFYKWHHDDFFWLEGMEQCPAPVLTDSYQLVG